jgi:hypothetical protein
VSSRPTEEKKEEKGVKRGVDFWRVFSLSFPSAFAKFGLYFSWLLSAQRQTQHPLKFLQILFTAHRCTAKGPFNG